MSEGELWGAVWLGLGWGLAAALGAELTRPVGSGGSGAFESGPPGAQLDRCIHAAAVAVTALLLLEMLLLLTGSYSRGTLGAGLVLLLLAARATRRAPAAAGSTRNSDESQRAGPAVVTVAGALLLWLGFCAASWTTLPSRADALAYHAPMAVQWIQQGSLWVTDTRVWFYPGNAELLLASNLLLVGSDSLAGSVDALLLGLLALAAAGIAQRAGHDWATACAAGLGIAATPLVLARLGSLDADLLLALAVVWVLYFAWSQRQGPQPALGRALVFISLGILAGTKYMGAGYAGLLAVAGAAVGGRSLWRGGAPWAGIAIGLALCLPFYARNAWLAGNPVFPLGLSLGPWALPQGDTAHLVATATPLEAAELARSALLTHAERARAIRLAATHLLPGALPALLLGALVLPWPRRSLAAPVRWLLFAAAGSWWLFGLTPFSAENVPGTLNQIASGQAWRFGLPALLFTGLAGVAACPRSHLLRVLASAAIASSGLLWALDGHPASGVAVVSGLVLWWLPAAGWQRLPGRDRLAARLNECRKRVGRLPAQPATQVLLVAMLVSLALAAALQTVAAGQARQRRLLASLDGRSGVVDWLDREACAHTLALTVGARAHPFLGSKWERRVVAIGMHPVAAADWRKRLAGPEVDHVVVTREFGDPASSSFGEFPPLDRWLAVRPDDFEPVYSDSIAHVYRTATGRRCLDAAG